MSTSELDSRNITLSMHVFDHNLTWSVMTWAMVVSTQSLEGTGCQVQLLEHTGSCFGDRFQSVSKPEISKCDLSWRKSVENLVISSQDAIGQSISQALTFSGVITQHANQTLHENRSVSRSPSPSLRLTDSATDVLEYDKGSEVSLQLPSLAAGDSASISSGEQITVVNAATLKDAKINSARGVDGARTKKKSWYNSLYPTYKSKSDDFKKLFKDLPEDERLIVDYSCALQKDILMHGRLYASQHYLCFHASIFGWETTLSLRWKDITAITKEKTALVIPNAILVCTESEKNFLTSFSGRDKAYLMLFRIWQNALMDQPMTSQEIWAWVHTCYGEELGFNSDDEGYTRDLPDDSNVLPDSVSEDLVDSSCMEASGGAAETREDPRTTRSASHGRDSSPPLVTNGDASYREEEAGDTLPTDMSDTSDSEPDKPHNGCESEKCTEAHDGKLLLRQQFPFNIDQMFTMIFTSSKFNLELLAARSTTDYVQAPWQQQGGLKCRLISYTLGLTSGPLGPKEVKVTETQVMNKCSKPGVLYSINSVSDNACIPYADYFSVHVHYCLARLADNCTDLQLYGHVRYKKTMWPMVKAFLEKNTMSGLEEFGRLLEARLSAEAESAVPAARKARRHRRLTASSQETAAVTVVKSPVLAAVAPRASISRARTHSNGGRWLAAALVLLLIVNGLLCWRLYTANKQTYGLDIEELQNKMSSMSGWAMSEWSRLLESHAARQRGQLRAWRTALDTTITHLHQTEQALAKLLETIKPSLERAQEEAEQQRNEL